MSGRIRDHSPTVRLSSIVGAREITMIWRATDIPDQSGRLAVITGANSGIGLETARELARRGAEVVMACRSETKAAAAKASILDEAPQAKIDVRPLDLSSLESVRAFAASFRESHETLDLLINNAGVMVPPLGKTADGFEIQFGTNHLGHFALTARLLDWLLATAGARVVTVSSVAHRLGQIRFDNLNAERGYSASRAYAQSKLCNLVFALELQRRLDDLETELCSVAAHPGWTATNLQDNSLPARFFSKYLAQSATRGALPTLRAATAPDVLGGQYYGPRGWFEMQGSPRRAHIAARAHRRAVAKRLWAVSEEQTGVRFELGR